MHQFLNAATTHIGRAFDLIAVSSPKPHGYATAGLFILSTRGQSFRPPPVWRGALIFCDCEVLHKIRSLASGQGELDAVSSASARPQAVGLAELPLLLPSALMKMQVGSPQ